MRGSNAGPRLLVLAVFMLAIAAAVAMLISTPSSATPVNTVTITGQVFKDVNGNGVKEGSDTGLSGWTIFIDANNNGVLDNGELSTTTDSQGNYSFTAPAPPAGSITAHVREVLQAAWLRTTNSPDVTVTSGGGTFSGRDFGDFRTISISGQTFSDLNGDGSLGGGEVGMQGSTVFLDTNANNVLDNGESSQVTGAGGTYSFTNLGPGNYRVREVTPAGYFRTTANPADIAAASGTNVDGSTNPGLNFGNFQLITISGTVFNDLNGNHLIDPGEPALVGWTVYIDTNNNGVLDAGESSITTGASGTYSFTNLGPGNYTVRLVVKVGWDATISPSFSFVASSGQDQTGVNFGSVRQFLVTNTNSAGAGSLSQAITDANASADTNVINISFGIPGSGVHTIALTSPLPPITHPVSIDGTTQPGFAGSPLIELNGAGAGTASGLIIRAGNSTVKGLVINRFALDGIALVINGGNVIAGNYIGTDVSGANALGNQVGVLIDSVTGNLIGGTVAGTRNLISGNTSDGIMIQNSLANGSIIQGNYIGTDVTGTTALGNRFDGVHLVASSNNTIGGPLINVHNIISGNGRYGIEIFRGSGNQLQGNYIGTDTTGAVALGNGTTFGGGIIIYESLNNTVGGTTTGTRNVISGNFNTPAHSCFGVRIGITSNGIGPSTGNSVAGNYIGTDASGTAALPNNLGIFLDDSASNNTLGGTASGAANLISGNEEGVIIDGHNSFIQGNLVGTDKSGTAKLPNGGDGILVRGGTGNLIGGTTPSARNIISGNDSIGIVFNLSNATSNTVQGNYVGTDITGTAALGNKFGGMSIVGSNNVIGGTTAGAGNVISGNLSDGLRLSGSGGTGNLVQGNLIGTKRDGINALGNQGPGVSIYGPAGNNTIGGTQADTSNIIAFNDVGVWITNNSVGNVILSNSIFNNTSLGIDLAPAGVTPNDPGDTDTGANNLQNFPQLSFANQTSSGTGVTGSLNSMPNTSFRIEFFLNQSCDPSGNGQGKLFVAASNVTTDANGIAPINSSVALGFDTSGWFITSTATRLDAQGNPIETSEFSNCVRVPFADLSITGTGSPNQVRSGDNLTYTLTVTNNGPDASTNVSVSDQLPSAVTLVSCAVTGGGICSNSTPNTVTAGLSTLASGAQAAITIQAKVGNAAGQLTDTASVLNTIYDPVQNNNSVTIKTDIATGTAVQFSQPTYVAAERGGSVAINVTRTGDTSVASSVDYATDDGSIPSIAVPCAAVTGKALERCDYTRATGTLQFAPNETQKTFTVLVNDDSYTEGTEGVSLVLSNPVGAVLGLQSSATLQITDDVPESSGNPVDDSSFVVRQHYHDFLNREADQSGLDFWTNEIESCGTSAPCRDVKDVNVSGAFFLSIEFQETGYLVERIYKTAFGDGTGSSNFPTPHQLPVPIIRLNEFLRDTQHIGQGVVVGVGDWQNQLESNKQNFALEFVSRQRFTLAYPASLTADQFVTQLNANAGQVLTTSDIAQLEALFGGAAASSNNNTNRASVLRQVAENATLKARESNSAFVLMQYFGYLRRNPNDSPDADYTGYDFWIQKLNQFNGNFVDAEMVKAFISSSEYRQRFGSQ